MIFYLTRGLDIKFLLYKSKLYLLSTFNTFSIDLFAINIIII